jgi:hypothetical protein
VDAVNYSKFHKCIGRGFSHLWGPNITVWCRKVMSTITCLALPLLHVRDDWNATCMSKQEALNSYLAFVEWLAACSSCDT